MNYAFVQAKATVGLFDELAQEGSKGKQREDRRGNRVRVERRRRWRLFAFATEILAVGRRRVSAPTDAA